MARRMPSPANPQMANQLQPQHPQYRPSTQLPPNVQHPSSPRPTPLQNPPPSSVFPSQPFDPKSPANPQLPHHYSPTQSKQPSLQHHSSTNPLPIPSQPSLSSQYQSDPHPPHNQLPPGSQNGKSSQSLEQSTQPSQTDLQTRQHPPPQKEIDYELTKESGHYFQDVGSEIKNPKGTSESENPGKTPALNWNEFPQHEDRWMGNRMNPNCGVLCTESTDDTETSDEASDDSL